MTERDKKIIADAEAQGIPIFVFVAKDKLSVDALDDYYYKAEEAECNKEFLDGIVVRAQEFQAWQDANSDKVKLPD